VSVPAAGAVGNGSKAGGGNVYNVTVTGVTGADEMNTTSFIRKLAEAIEATLDGDGVPV
jgi:tryptophan synthase alpha subunit